MANREWDEPFEDLLRSSLPLLAAEDALDPVASLQDLGLDSLMTVNLLVRLEDEFHVLIPDEALTLETFATARTLWTVIASLRESETS
ncbi:phosphopantetheine-binding protein [Streptomyces solisilvae]|uniref:phosphopantetheine-binding protein n=1 Tax=Streptomyces malaysiensis TaxID=92644 RepID=UPI0036B9DC59